MSCWHGYLSGVRCKWLAWSSWCHCHIVSCFIKIQTGITFLVPAYPGCPGKEAIKRVSVCLSYNSKKQIKTRMWANVQRDGRPAEYRWCSLLNAAKFGWRPLLECRAVTMPRRESRSNLQGCPKLANRSQPLGGRSSPHYKDMWGRYRCLTSFFFWLSIHASAAKIQLDKIVRWCQHGDFFASCIFSEPRAAHFRHAF